MTTKENTTPLAVDVKVLARMLGCSVRHIERLDASGQLPRAFRLGKSKRWSLASIKAWLADGAPDRDTWENRGGAAS